MARDSFDILYLYKEFPYKENDVWDTCNEYYLELNKELFLFVEWEDNEPYDLRKLIENR